MNADQDRSSRLRDRHRRPSAFIGGAVLALVILSSTPTPALADDKAKPANPPAAKPSNPLLEDPFIGEFEGAGMVLAIKPAAGGEGYVGEIRRRGQTFAVKASLKGEGFAGSFTFEQFSYEFTCRIEDDSLKFTTDGKTFSLKRRAAGAAADPAAARPAPPAVTPPADPLPAGTTPAPKPPANDPVEALLNPRPPKGIPAPPPAPIDYAGLSSQQLRQVCWTRFPAGASAVFEDTAAVPDLLPQSLRYKLVYAGIGDGKVKLKQYDPDGSGWKLANDLAVAPTDEAIRIGDMGYTKGETTFENLSIGGAMVRCERTAYSGQADAQGSPMHVKVLIWRSSAVDIPTHVLDLPKKRLLLEPDMAKVQARIEYRQVNVDMAVQLDAMHKEGRVGSHAVQYAIVTGISSIESSTTRIDRTSESWLSHQVPGGIIKTVVTEKRGQGVKQRITVMVDFTPSEAKGGGEPVTTRP